MPQRNFFILVVLIFFSFGEILGQQKNVENIPVPHFFGLGSLLHSPLYPEPENLAIRYKKSGWEPQKFTGSLLGPVAPLTLQSPLAATYYCDHLGFFCRKELQIEKITAIPFRFRLGSLEYTDYLEGKGFTQRR